MQEFTKVFEAVLPVFGLVGVGLLVRKLNWLTEEADQSLLRVNINLLMPCLILDAALGNPALARWSNLLLAPLVGFATLALGMGLALVARPLHGLSDPRQARTFAASVGIYNYGFIPLPLALLLFDEQTVGVLFVHNVGVEMGLWTLGVMLMTGGGVGRDWRKILNAPLVAIALALLLNAVGQPGLVTGAVRTGMHWLAQCAVPMALVLVGAVMADHLHEFHSAHGWRVMSGAALLRLVMLPGMFLMLAKVLPTSIELKRVMVLQATMPAAVFPILMARHYGGDAPTALRVVVATSVPALITTPLWVRLGLAFLGL